MLTLRSSYLAGVARWAVRSRGCGATQRFTASAAGRSSLAAPFKPNRRGRWSLDVRESPLGRFASKPVKRPIQPRVDRLPAESDRAGDLVNRITGSRCSAIQTVPIPPSPMHPSNLYHPATTVPAAATASGTPLVVESPPGGRERVTAPAESGGAASGFPRAASGRSWAASSTSSRSAVRTPVEERPPGLVVGQVEGGDEQLLNVNAAGICGHGWPSGVLLIWRTTTRSRLTDSEYFPRSSSVVPANSGRDDGSPGPDSLPRRSGPMPSSHLLPTSCRTQPHRRRHRGTGFTNGVNGDIVGTERQPHRPETRPTGEQRR